MFFINTIIYWFLLHVTILIGYPMKIIYWSVRKRVENYKIEGIQRQMKCNKFRIWELWSLSSLRPADRCNIWARVLLRPSPTLGPGITSATFVADMPPSHKYTHLFTMQTKNAVRYIKKTGFQSNMFKGRTSAILDWHLNILAEKWPLFWNRRNNFRATWWRSCCYEPSYVMLLHI
jgi:hypothetical protein